MPFVAVLDASVLYPLARTSCSRACAASRGRFAGSSGWSRTTYCIDVLTQISAAQAALEKVALGLLDGRARSCVPPAAGQLQADRTDELMAAVGRLVKRG